MRIQYVEVPEDQVIGSYTSGLKPVGALDMSRVLSRDETRAWTTYPRTLLNGGRFDDGSSMPLPIDPPVVSAHA
jgi:hypothetical protein